MLTNPEGVSVSRLPIIAAQTGIRRARRAALPPSFAVDYPLTIAPEGRARVFVISKINIGSSIIHNNDLSSLANEIYPGKVFPRPVRSPRATSRFALPNQTSRPSLNSLDLSHSLSLFLSRPLALSPSRRTPPSSRAFPMTGVITFLCCSDTRWYVTAAGSICPVALAPVFAMANVICPG